MVSLNSALNTCMTVAVLTVIRTSGNSIQPEPGFVGASLKNVTVPEGRDVVLSCTVKNLDSHKVAWIHYDRSAILTVQNHVITRNPRIGVSHEGHRTWNLHIRDVQQSDGGSYMCQINTAKAKTRLGYLNVVVPPRIDDSKTSGDKVRAESSNVTLECTANGSPQPVVTWKREDGLPISIDKTHNITVPQVEGPILKLYKVSRLDMGAYMCIASNGVPPAVSKRIQLGIDFPPMMWVPAQQMSVVRGTEAKLICYVEAHPEALTFWEQNGRMLQPGGRVSIKTHTGNPKYKIGMELRISQVYESDFGVYTCIAKNPRGQTDGSITMREEIPLTTTPLDTTSTHVVIVPKKANEYQTHSKDHAYGSSMNEFGSNEDAWRKKDGEKKQRDDQRKPHHQIQDTTSSYDSDQLYGQSSSSSTSKTHQFLLIILPLVSYSLLVILEASL